MNYKALIFIVCSSFFLRTFLVSNYLDCWDSVQFTMAINNYSIAMHQPHPPGFPVYIFMGRLTNIFVNDPQQALLFVSVFCGTLSLIPTYLIGKSFFDEWVGILAMILLSLNPTHLLYSEIVMTDIFSMFFLVIVIWLLYSGIESNKSFYLAAFILGISFGIRPTDTLLIGPLCLAVIFFRKQLKGTFFFMSAVLSGIGLWLIPMIIDTGLSTYIEVSKAHWNFNQNISTLSQNGGLSSQGLILTSKALLSLFITGWSQVFLVFFSISLILSFIKLLNLRKSMVNVSVDDSFWDRRLIFFICWLIPFVLFAFFNYWLYTPRYLLPVFPLLSIIFSYSMVEILRLIKDSKIKILLSSFFVLLIIFMSFQAISGAYDIHNTIPAPVQAAEFIQGNYSPADTIIVGGESFRHFQYYLPSFTVKHGTPTDQEYLEYLQNKTVICTEDSLLFDSDVKSFEFTRDYNIYPKHYEVRLYEYKINSWNSTFILRCDGFHTGESQNGILKRWMTSDAKLVIYSNEECNANFSFKARSFYRPRTLEVYTKDGTIFQQIIPTSFSNITFMVPLNKGINNIRFYVPDGAERPCDIEELRSGDSRYLSIAVQDVMITV